MSKSTGIWDTVLKLIIAVASAVLGVFGANAMTF